MHTGTELLPQNSDGKITMRGIARDWPVEVEAVCCRHSPHGKQTPTVEGGMRHRPGSLQIQSFSKVQQHTPGPMIGADPKEADDPNRVVVVFDNDIPRSSPKERVAVECF